jgi:hypothetical protein
MGMTLFKQAAFGDAVSRYCIRIQQAGATQSSKSGSVFVGTWLQVTGPYFWNINSRHRLVELATNGGFQFF